MSYRLRIQLSNRQQQSRRVVIHGGTIFEVEDPFSDTQNLVVASQTVVTLPPGGSQIVEIDTWCLNRSFSPPHNTPMRATVMSTSRKYVDQSDVWNDMTTRR
jgi:hypothetical protein